MNLSDTNGKHIAFYYCGTDHLVINLMKYVKDGLDNNEMVYIYCRNDIYEAFTNFLAKKIVKAENLVKLSLDKFISAHKENGLQGLEEKIDEVIKSSKALGYNGVRCIRQVNLTIEETTKEDYLSFERDISQAINDKDFSCICAYDFDDFINDRAFIDKDVLDASRETHTHQLFKFEFVEMV